MIHDLVPLHHPEWVTARTRSMHAHKYRNAARTCDVIFTNSAFTADDTEATLGFPREQIVVARPGIGADFTHEGEVAELDRPFALTVATLEPRKNLGTSPRSRPGSAARATRASHSPSSADRGGASSLSSTRRASSGLGFGSSDAELAGSLPGCIALMIYPSQVRGASGCRSPRAMGLRCGPSSRPSHPSSSDEACGDAAVRADPESVDAFEAAIREGLKRRDELRWKGFAHAATFSWRRTGELMLEGYRRFS